MSETQEQARISKKLSAKEVMGGMSAILRDYLMVAGEGVEVPLFRLIGTGEALRPFSSDFGDGVAVRGEFEAVNLLTGETFIGTESYMPGEVNNMIAAAMKTGENKSRETPVRDEKGEIVRDADGKAITRQSVEPVVRTVDFAFEVLGVYDPKSTTQYVYRVKSLMGVQTSDRIKSLKANVPAFAAAGLLPPAVLEVLKLKGVGVKQLAAPIEQDAPTVTKAPQEEVAKPAPKKK